MARVTDDRNETQMYDHDIAPVPAVMRAVFNYEPDFVVLPKNTKEVSEIVQLAGREDMPIVPRGAGTWGLGGATPVKGGVLLNMANMDRVLDVDPENMTVTVEAGITWKKLSDHLSKRGLFLGCYPSSAPAATVGGWISTGGVGIGSYKYGSAGDLIRSLKVVLPSGDILETSSKSVPPNGSGYMLNWLFVGAEGTLGVVTEATLKVLPCPSGGIHPMSYTFESLLKAIGPLRDLAKSRANPLHISFGDARHYDFLRAAGSHVPKDVRSIVNVVLEGEKGVVREEEKLVDAVMKEKGGVKLPEEVANIEWEERSFEFSVRKKGVATVPGEIIVPLKRFGEVLEGTYELIDKMKMNASVIGSLPDRSSVMVMPYYLMEEGTVKGALAMGFNKKLDDLAGKFDGRAIGHGLYFASNLKKVHGGVGHRLMCDIKNALDPKGIMNPGKLLETGTGLGVAIPAPLMAMGMNFLAVMKQAMPRDRLDEKFLQAPKAVHAAPAKAGKKKGGK